MPGQPGGCTCSAPQLEEDTVPDPSESQYRAKEPVTAALAGPYGHPFHPMLVTVPIGAWVSSLVFDVAAHFVHQPQPLAIGARWLIAIGVLSAVAAATVGFLDFFALSSGTRARRVAVTHMVLNLVITVAFAGNFLWRVNESSPTAVGPLVLSLVSLAGLGVSGTLGGKLAYHYGVRVAAETVQADGFRTTAHPSRPQSRIGSSSREGE
jgi:uncharacterized membrane protein